VRDDGLKIMPTGTQAVQPDDTGIRVVAGGFSTQFRYSIADSPVQVKRLLYRAGQGMEPGVVFCSKGFKEPSWNPPEEEQHPQQFHQGLEHDHNHRRLERFRQCQCQRQHHKGVA